MVKAGSEDRSRMCTHKSCTYVEHRSDPRITAHVSSGVTGSVVLVHTIDHASCKSVVLGRKVQKIDENIGENLNRARVYLRWKCESGVNAFGMCSVHVMRTQKR
eukprot:TRINITY_DN1296_c0_g1_i3.p2 TRINITY_DN1296_c0_g1~~TRINITY_DN1296_c0_g1_i3.p2  ORF type:complete len:104 (-),score=4.21 TRINITY_DN1296_c0_g1_i3:10-321(-)